MSYRDTAETLDTYRKQIRDLRTKMHTLQASRDPEPVKDYTLRNIDGPVRLSALFGSKRDLIVIHNMGTSCTCCTLWADGFNGIYDHLANRAAFVVTSPDTPEVQMKFAASRSWRFPMVSHAGTSFAADMGFRGANGGWMPGVSVFRKDGSAILRVSDAPFDVGDDFCALWHFMDLLPEGAAGWKPKYSYG
jgi:predicted dithiol-disulfide oxidoreductase (DUF899 family)